MFRNPEVRRVASLFCKLPALPGATAGSGVPKEGEECLLAGE